MSWSARLNCADARVHSWGSTFLLPTTWMSWRISFSLLNYSLVFSRRARWLMGPIKPCLLDADRGRRRRRQPVGMGEGSSSLWWMVTEVVLTSCVIQHLEMYWWAYSGGLPALLQQVASRSERKRQGDDVVIYLKLKKFSCPKRLKNNERDRTTFAKFSQAANKYVNQPSDKY